MRISLFITNVVVGVALSIAGCSPNAYKEPIGKFGQAMSKTRTAYEELRSQQRTAATEILIRNLLDQPSKLQNNVGCEVGGASPCGLTRADGADSPIFPPDKEGAKLALLLKLMEEYAGNLAKIAGSETADAVNEAAASTSASIKQLADTVGSRVGSNVSAKVGMLEGVFRWAVAAYVDQKRYNALRSAVLSARPSVKAAGDELQEVLPSFAQTVVISLESRLDHGLDKLHDTNGLTEEKRFQIAVSLADQSRALREFASQDPNKVITKMVEAHEKIAVALEDDQGNLEEIFAFIQSFSDQVDAIIGVLRAQ